MISRQEMITEAREWIGTPVRVVGAERGVGCNCAGFCAGVAKAAGLGALWAVFEPHAGAKVPETKTSLLAALEANLDRIAKKDVVAGCLIATRESKVIDYAAHHLAVVSRVVGDDISIIEASGPAVGEWRLTSDRRVVRVFQIPGVSYGS